MMKNNELQNKISDCFRKHFGYTPLNERLKDIQREFFELMKWSDVKNLKEETGDLISSLIMLCDENEWNFEDLVNNTLSKIESREKQYKSLGRKTKVAILGGAFNPIHKGHIQTAQFILNTSGEFDEVWLLPAYKHMYGKHMVSPEHRINMCKLAAEVDNRIKIFDYEIKNELAGETYYLIKKLKLEKELNEKYNFSFVIGLDNANSFDKWVNYSELERLIRMVIIPRKGYKSIENAWYFNAPHIYLNSETDIIETSSTDIREMIKQYIHGDLSKDEILKHIDIKVFNYIFEHSLYA